MNTGLRFLEWLLVIRRIRQWLRQASELLELPDVNDPGAVYGWCRSVLTLARESVKLTPTEVDDRIVTWLLDVPFATFESFEPFYRVFRVILELIDSEESHESIAVQALEAADDKAVARLSDNPVGLEPFALVALIVSIIRLLIELRRK